MSHSFSISSRCKMARIKAGGKCKSDKRGGKAKEKERKEGMNQGRKETRCGQDRILRGRESDTAEREMQFVAASVAVESQPRVDR